MDRDITSIAPKPADQITIRDEFAMAAITDNMTERNTPFQIAKKAYEIADAMMIQRRVYR